MVVCQLCSLPFRPEDTRWRCPFCGNKESCCEGEALPSVILSQTPSAPA